MRISTLTLLVLLSVSFAQENPDSTYSDTTEAASMQTQTTPDSTDTMKIYIGEELLVVEEKFVSSPALKYAKGMVISDSTIVENHRNTFEEVFSKECGIYVKSGQFPGMSATPFLQGGAMVHQRFLLDGLPVAFPQLGQFDINYQPLWSSAKIEIIPGALSSLYGSGGVAGSVNFHTKSDFRSGAFTRVEIANGDYDYNWLALKMNHHLFDRIGVDIAGSKLTSDGELSGENSKSENLSAKIAVAIAQGWNVETYAQSHAGWLNYLSFGSIAEQHDDATIGAIHLNGIIEKIGLRASAQLEKYDQLYNTDFYDFNYKADVLTGDLRAVREFKNISGSIFTQIQQYDISGTMMDERKLKSYSAGAQAEAKFDRISALLSGRFDRDFSENNLLNAGAGFRYDMPSGLFASLSAGMGFRSPTPNDLWYPHTFDGSYSMMDIDSAGDTSYIPLFAMVSKGNDSLAEEKSISFSITTGYNKDALGASLSGFITKYANLIEWNYQYLDLTDSLDTSFTYPENLDAATIFGATLKMDYSLSSWLNTGLSYTFLSAKDSSGEKLPERAEHYLSATIGTKYSFWDNKLSFSLALEPTYIGAIRYYSDTTETVPGFLLGARASIKYLDFELFSTAQNLTDNRYKMFNGRNSLGKWLKVGIGWDFRN